MRKPHMSRHNYTRFITVEELKEQKICKTKNDKIKDTKIRTTECKQWLMFKRDHEKSQAIYRLKNTWMWFKKRIRMNKQILIWIAKAKTNFWKVYLRAHSKEESCRHSTRHQVLSVRLLLSHHWAVNTKFQFSNFKDSLTDQGQTSAFQGIKCIMKQIDSAAVRP